MKLYDGGFLFLCILAVFGYVTYQVDKTTDHGKSPISARAVKDEVKEDYHEIEAFLASGDTANHKRYNN